MKKEIHIKKSKPIKTKKGKTYKRRKHTRTIVIDPIPVILYTIRDKKTGRILGQTTRKPK